MTLNPLRWERTRRNAFLATTVFGACMGFVAGIRRVDPGLDQDLYWLWLLLWVAPAAVLCAAGALLLQSLRRS